MAERARRGYSKYGHGPVAIFSDILLLVKRTSLLFLVFLAVTGIFLYVYRVFPSDRFEVIYPIIVPHFDTFEAQRQNYLKDLSQKIRPEKIILMSVDHYNYGRRNISAMTGTWRLKTGDIQLEQGVFAKLVASSAVYNDENAFITEHGIKNVVPDLVAYFPDIDILPIMVKDSASRVELDNLYQGIWDNCQANCLVVGSVDFSHYNPRSLAQIHDTYAIKALNSLSETQVSRAETDSPNILSLLVRLANSQGARGFRVAFNGNSGAMMQDDSIETTSVVIGQFQPEKIDDRVTTLMFAGDILTDSQLPGVSQSYAAQVFGQMGQRVLWGTDSATVSSQGLVSPAILEYLHIDNVASGDVDSVAVREHAINGDIPVSILTIDVSSASDLDAFKAAIISSKRAGQYVVVSPRWGDRTPGRRRQMAAEILGAGADMILGAGLSGASNFEMIDGKLVIYSLGNLLGDRDSDGLIVGLVVTHESVSVSLFPTKQIGFQPRLITGEEKTSKLQALFDLAELSGFAKVGSDTIKIDRLPAGS